MKQLRITSLALLVVSCGGSVSGGPPSPPVSDDAGLGGDRDATDTSSADARTDTTTEVDVAVCSPVLASDYDQSCVADTDCVTVGQVTQCPAVPCDACPLWAINAVEATQYQAAFTRAIASEPAGEGCACPCAGIAICRNGKCKQGYCIPDRADTLAACADAGGRCSYAANTTCSALGPPSSCAFADETCCLR
jgi:hypothetical protein